MTASFQDLLQQSHSQKLFANTLFSSSHYTDAISKYEQALSLCPNYLDYEIAILKSNIAACFIKLEDWKAAVDSATEALDRLDRILQVSSSLSSFKGKDMEKEDEEVHNNFDGKVVEITAEGGGEQEEKDALAALQKQDKQKVDGQRIRAKALLRRARAKSELGGWANLQAAHEGILPAPSHSLYKIPPLTKSHRLYLTHKNPLPTYTRTTTNPTRLIFITVANNPSKRKGNGGNVGQIKRRTFTVFFHLIFMVFVDGERREG